MSETRKAKPRREREGFFSRFIQGTGIEIGCGRVGGYGIDLVEPSAIAHDQDICDATEMTAYVDSSFDYAHASHVLEHLWDPETAIQNWMRILRTKGHLIICVPHKDLYERKPGLPSRWNGDHKRFYTPGSLLGEIERALAPLSYSLVYCKDLREGWVPVSPMTHASGEYSIECVLQKL